MAKPPKDLLRAHRLCWTLAKKYHQGQTYGDGRPYFSAHIEPIHDHFVKVGLWKDACLTLVHDLVEDHGDQIGYERLAAFGMPVWLLKSLRAITKLKDEPYEEYLARVMSDEIAWRVKIRDVLFNAHSPGCGLRRLRKYAKALTILTEKAPEHIIT